MRHQFYLELICENCFAHSDLVQRVPWFKERLVQRVLSNFWIHSVCICELLLRIVQKTNLWEMLSNDTYSIFDKNKWKSVKQMLLCYSWKVFIKLCIKVIAVTHNKWKVFQKQTFHLNSTIYLLLRCLTEKKTQLYKQASGLQLYLKRDSGTGVFLWILWNF